MNLKTLLKNKLLVIILTLPLVNLMIFLDIPVFRQILSFAYFTIVPGLLILYMLGLSKLDPLRKFVLSYGLSISFLMFVGLLINTLYPFIGITRPLSPSSLAISFSIAILILCFIVYVVMNSKEFNFQKVDFFSISMWYTIKTIDRKSYLVSPLIFSLIFPLLSILGVYLMNTTKNNIILLMLPFLIVIYAAIIVYINEKIPRVTYPVAILMIGISIAFILPLRGEYMIFGGDGPNEYYFFWMTASKEYWNIYLSRDSPINACLSVTILHTVIQSLTNLHMRYAYKLITPMLLSVVPLALFIIYREYIGDLHAFLVSLFFASQYNFIYSINNARVLVSLFFVTMTLFIILDGKINNNSVKRLLLLIFAFSVVLSYYSYSYILSILLFLSLLILRIMSVKSSMSYVNSNLNFFTLFVFVIAIILWWAQITGSHWSYSIWFLIRCLESLAQPTLAASQEVLAQKAVGMGLHGLADRLSFVIYYLTLSFIIVGSASLVFCKNTKFRVYISFVMSCMVLWLITALVPLISEGLGLSRVYILTLVILSPMVVIGVETTMQILSKSIEKFKKIRWNRGELNNSKLLTPAVSLAIILLIILFQLLVNIGFIHYIFGNPRSIIINSEGLQYDIWYIHKEDIVSARWLCENTDGRIRVYGSMYTLQSFFLLPEHLHRIKLGDKYFKWKSYEHDGYIYLGYTNVVNRKIIVETPRLTENYAVSITEYESLLIHRDKIYNNGFSEIYK